MADGKRPGGLTALAVLNFVFAGLGLIGLLALTALLGAVDSAARDAGFQETGNSSGMIYGFLALGVVRMGVLLAAGVGYIGMKRWGRKAGNLYAILALLDTVGGMALIKGSSMGIGVIIGLVYPVLTLILVNTTFKDDLVN